MKVVYCTVLNAAFVPRALTLQRSIAAHTPNANFAFFCIDDAAVTLLRDLAPSKAWIVAPSEFETARLLAVKPRLKLNEYCWTCKPFTLSHALDRDAGVDWAVWLDADMFTFGDLDSPLRAVPDANVAMTPHGAPDKWSTAGQPRSRRLLPIAGITAATLALLAHLGGGALLAHLGIGAALTGLGVNPSSLGPGAPPRRRAGGAMAAGDRPGPR